MMPAFCSIVIGGNTNFETPKTLTVSHFSCILTSRFETQSSHKQSASAQLNSSIELINRSMEQVKLERGEVGIQQYDRPYWQLRDTPIRIGI